MSTYEKIESLFRKKQIFEYEKLIDDINYCYDINSANFKHSKNENRSKISLILANGSDWTNSNLDFYLSSNLVDSEFENMISEIDELCDTKGKWLSTTVGEISEYELFVEWDKKIIPKIETMKEELQKQEKFIYSLVRTFGEVPSVDNLKNMEFLYKKYLESPDSFGYYQRTLLFFLGVKIIPEYKDILKIINEEKSKVSNKENFNITLFVQDLLIRGKIDVNAKSFFDSFEMLFKYDDLKNKEKELNKKLEDKLPEALSINFFLKNSENLKSRVSTMLELGVPEEEALKNILPDAYGLVKSACEYMLGQKAYDVQLMGAIAMNEGKVCEMYTGEGKTLTAIFPAYLNALLGKEVDIFTPNDYLAERDANKNRKVFELLGMTVGCVKVDDQTIEEKQKAYKCDIVYGSSNAFAFDYLNDTNRQSPEFLVQRAEKPGFVIVDEADQILINNAQTPYILENSSRALSQKDKQENLEVIKNLKNALEIEKILSKKVYTSSSIDEFNLITGDNKEETKKMNDAYSLLVLKENTSGKSKVVLTNHGERILFSCVMQQKIQELTLKNSEFFATSDEFVEGKDYKFSDGNIVLSLKGIDKAIEKTKDFFDLNMSWLTEPKHQVIRKYVNNAISARYVMEKGINYQVAQNPETNREEVFVLQDGRILPDSKFVDGLHQAIELKEGLGVIFDKNEKLIDDSIASISNRALISRYGKISGMTGTADKSMFNEVYGLDTFEVPRNKQYEYTKNPIVNEPPIERKDNPTVLCKTKKDKMNRIKSDIVFSALRGQPVLVVTNNDEEAKEIYEEIQKLNEIYKFEQVNLLIAGQNLEEEGRIISEAGKIGSITISTEMAGRGTDIKLGGEKELDFELNKQEIFEIEAVNLKLQQVLSDKRLNYEDSELTNERKEKIRNIIKEKFETDKSAFDQEISKLKEKYENDTYYKGQINYLTEQRIDSKKKEVYDKGGLKYIQTTPFKTTRNDNQGKGRVGRQGEPGETTMYLSMDELTNIGIDDKRTKEKLLELLGDNRYINDVEAEGVISDVIEAAQRENEFQIDVAIAMTDTNDLAMSAMGQTLLRNRREVLSSKNIDVMMENMIFSTIDSIMKDNVPSRKRKKIDKDKSKLSKLKLDTDKLISDVKNIFGINLDISEMVNECTSVGDLKWFIYDRAMVKKEQLDIGFTKEQIDSKNKETILKSLNETYITFMEEAKTIELQIMNDRIANNADHNRVLEFQSLYNDCVKTGWYSCVKNAFKPGLRKKDELVEFSSEVKELIEELKKQANYDSLYSSEEVIRNK